MICKYLLTSTLLCISCDFSFSYAARILAWFPYPSISHQVVFRPLTQELAKRGHEVVVLTPDPAFPKGHTPKNLTEIDLHKISYKGLIVESAKWVKKADNELALLKEFTEFVASTTEQQLLYKEVQEIIYDKRKFDLLLLEATLPQVFILSHIHKVPVIGISSLSFDMIGRGYTGAPEHPIFYPMIFRQRFYNLTWWETIFETFFNFALPYILIKYNEHAQIQMLRRNFGPDTPSINELTNNVNMLFLNSHTLLPSPTPPAVIYIGGIHEKEEDKLPEDLKILLDSSVNGVIYTSFGTNNMVAYWPNEIIQVFVNVFSQLPYDILWKWEKDELPGRSDNIKIAKWFPQLELLKHPKVKLFITQGGLQSTDEAIIGGVPMIGIPLHGDQWYNVENYLRFNIGLKIDLKFLTEDILRDAIHTITKDKSYKENVLRLRELMADQPQRPLERAVWWTEYVLRHAGARHLRAPAANMPLAQYYELELAAIVLLCIIVSCLTIGSLIYMLIKYVFSKTIN